MKTIKYISLISLFYFGSTQVLWSQDTIKKEVVVVKPYVPVVSDASKINAMPVFNDTVKIKPSFDYKIVPNAINTEYQLTNINPARLVSPPLTKLYKNYIKLGLGNYATPLAEVYINSQRSKSYTYGIYLHHQSSGGKLKLENNEKVLAGYSDNEALVFGKKFFKKSFLYADGGFIGNRSYQYGYNTEIDTTLEDGDIRQTVFVASLNAGFRSIHNDSSDLSYHFSTGYKYIRNRYDQGQGDFRMMAEGSKLYKKSLVGLRTQLMVIKPNTKMDSLGYSNTNFNLHPFFISTAAEYRLKLGLDLNFENQQDKLSFRLYPDVELSINIAKDALIGYVGLQGQLKEHNYYSIITENPFIRPGLTVKNTYYSNTSYGGIKGSFGLKASYVLNVNFTRIKNDYFFVNDTSTLAQNQFTVVYDNSQKMNVYFETNYDFSKSLNFSLIANYYDYQAESEIKAWHKPNYDVTFSTKYNLRNKILANIDLLAIGARYARTFGPMPASKELPGVVDINLGLEYRYTKILSGWIRINNLLASKYYAWNFYPTQRINLMLGITYSL